MIVAERFSERVNYEVDNHVAVISLDRPERLNAFDAAMYEGVNQALISFRDDDLAWVAVLQATKYASMYPSALWWQSTSWNFPPFS